MYCKQSNFNPLVKQAGFSLLEMAVVMVILGLLLGGLLGPMSIQRENRNQNEVKQLLLEIEDAMLGFVAIHGYLPCPASAGSSGLEARNGANNCTAQHGFVPTTTLGLQGKLDTNNRLLDPWLVPIRYSLSSVNSWEYAKGVSLTSGAGDFRVCSQASCSNVLAQDIVAVIFSLGEFGALATSSVDQLENTDSDTVFVWRTFSEASGSEFNDSLRWISPNVIVHELVSAGRL